ncbi:hypothetical protein [Nocardia transvalensis]|uniref:hypothetical protein n=1 Tax=Nocardia transvalensis TaxID=37333 RepID=UPI001893F19B|nr:hypothetical protein [Nocardia transvalensis]MBF6332379.1 hypothetical protein [Nocardia transvalensis]
MTTDLYFAAGAMLTVLRAAQLDPHGDGEFTDHHQVGPADIPETSASVRKPGDPRATRSVPVRIPAGQDIRHADRVRLPNGAICTVVTHPETPTNPFTGWRPFTYFVLEG